jgi:hypothetical protein
MKMADDALVMEDERVGYDDGTVVAVRILDVPASEKHPDGVKYKFHYSEAGADDPIIRFDNHHGPHELHIAGQIFEIEFPGVQKLYRTWRQALPPTKRIDW